MPLPSDQIMNSNIFLVGVSMQTLRPASTLPMSRSMTTLSVLPNDALQDGIASP
jgi:hypothetical protein